MEASGGDDGDDGRHLSDVEILGYPEHFPMKALQLHWLATKESKPDCGPSLHYQIGWVCLVSLTLETSFLIWNP